MEERQFSIIGTFKFAWNKFKEKALFFVGLAVLTAFISSIGEADRYTGYINDQEAVNNSFSLLSTLGFIISTYLSWVYGKYPLSI